MKLRECYDLRECEVWWRMAGLSRQAADCCYEGSSRTALESECLTEAPARGIPGWLKDSAEADQGSRTMTAAERVVCWPGDWLLFLLALKEGLNTLMECSGLRLCPDSWNTAYVSDQYRLPLSETNSMWESRSGLQYEKLQKAFLWNLEKNTENSSVFWRQPWDI